MGLIFAYSITASITLLLVWCIYKLDHSVSPRQQRIILLSGYALALIIVPALLSINLNERTSTAILIEERLPEVLITGNNNFSALPIFILVIYICGVSACMLMTLFEFMRITALFIQAKHLRGNIYVSHRNNVAPFSFGNKIIVSSNDANNADILTHESTHAACHHTFDIILAQLTAAICWYCPAAWLLRRKLKLVHEFQADEAVINNGADIVAYSQLLIERASGIRIVPIANTLSDNNLKLRIKMMQNPIFTDSGTRVRTLLLPAAAMICAVALLSVPSVSHAIDRISCATLANKGLDTNAPGSTTFIIYGVDINNSKTIKKGNFTTVADFESGNLVAADVDGVIFPKIGAIFCSKKEVLNRLTPGIKKYMVDGIIMNPKEFAKISEGKLRKVIVSGNSMNVFTVNQTESKHFNAFEDAVNAENN